MPKVFCVLNTLIYLQQIANVANGYIASADEEYVLGNKIPLWLFGFLY